MTQNSVLEISCGHCLNVQLLLVVSTHPTELYFPLSMALKHGVVWLLRGPPILPRELATKVPHQLAGETRGFAEAELPAGERQ